MKISELMEKLEAISSEYGDCDVCYVDNGRMRDE